EGTLLLQPALQEEAWATERTVRVKQLSGILCVREPDDDSFDIAAPAKIGNHRLADQLGHPVHRGRFSRMMLIYRQELRLRLRIDLTAAGEHQAARAVRLGRLDDVPRSVRIGPPQHVTVLGVPGHRGSQMHNHVAAGRRGHQTLAITQVQDYGTHALLARDLLTVQRHDRMVAIAKPLNQSTADPARRASYCYSHTLVSYIRRCLVNFALAPSSRRTEYSVRVGAQVAAASANRICDPHNLVTELGLTFRQIDRGQRAGAS